MANLEDKSAPRLHTPEEIARETTRNAQLKLLEENRKIIAERVAENSNDPDWALQAMGETATQFMKRLDQTGKQLTSDLKNNKWMQRMQKAFSNDDKAEGVLESIFEKIATEVPGPDGDTRKVDHPYIQKNFFKVEGLPKKIPNYGINSAIYKDADFINGALSKPGLTEEQRSVLMDMGQALQTFAMNDWNRWAKEMATNARKNNYSDKVILEMGTVGVALAAASAAVLTGIMSLSSGKASAAPLLYGGIAGILAFPDARKAIFGGKHQVALDQLGNNLDKNFRKSAASAKVEGRSGEKLLTRLMHPDAEIDTFNEHMKLAVSDPTNLPTKEEKDAFAEMLAPKNENFRNILDDPDPEQYLALTQVENITDPDAQKTVKFFGLSGAAKYNREASQKIKLLEQSSEVLPA